LSLRGIFSLILLALYLKRRSVDIVQTYFIDSTIFGVVAAKLAGVKVIISCRRDLGFWYTKSLLKKFKLINRLTDRFLVNSLAIKNNIVRYEKVSEKMVDVIHNGIDALCFQEIRPAFVTDFLNDSKRRNLRIGIVANFNRDVKRVDLFVEAAAEVSKKHQKINFFIVGGGKQEEALKSLTRKLGIAQSVFFTGEKDSATPYIKNFDIGVLTSDSEGFSNVIMEYMAAGVPVVATNVGGNNELVQHGKTGLLVPKGDPVAIANAICLLVEDHNLRYKMGKFGLNAIQENFSWDKKIIEIQNYYQTLAEMG
jgi:glycosyltransferase involved in cell wall biosynthesis